MRTLVALTLAAVAVAGPFAARAGASFGSVTEFPAGTSTLGDPDSIASGPDGNVWFTEYTGDKIGRITPDGTITEFDVPTASAGPNTIAAGPDGNLWFTEVGANKIGRITPGGAITEFGAGITAASQPWGIASGPDGNVWFTEFAAGKVARITPGGTVTEFSTAAGGGPRQITTGPDGNLWFTEYTSGKIGRITTAGAVQPDFSPETASSKPEGITLGQDGNMWFAESAVNKIGEMTTTGGPSDFTVPTANSNPVGVAPGLDGNLWFAEYNDSRIGLFNPLTFGGTITDSGNGISATSHGVFITAGADGNVWFTEGLGNKIGRITTGAAPPWTALPTVTGGGEEGTAQTCSPGTWVTWASHQPVVVGDLWLLDGAFVAGGLTGTYTPQSAAIGHQLSCEEVVTYPNLNVTFGSRSAPVTVTAPPVPACSNESVSTPGGGAALGIVLQCTGPAGFRLNYAIAGGPAHGTLGPVDQATGTVIYTPAAGFSGADQITYRASDDGGSSNTATVQIAVPAPSSGGGGGGGGPVGPGVAKVAARITYTFRVVGTKTAFHELKATGVAGGQTVLLRCSGRGCPFKSRKVPVSAKGVADAVASLPKRRRKQGVVVRAGATLTILVTAPHATGKALTFKARNNAAPVKHVLCVKPGASAPTAC